MALWSTLTHRILLEVPRCSIPLAEEAARDATIALCEAAQLYVHTLPTINVTGGTPTYAVTSDVAETEIAAVRKAWYDGCPLDFAPLDALNDARHGWWEDTADKPTAFTQYEPGAVILYPIPNSDLADGLRVEVALRPTTAATGVVDWIAAKYAQEITCGAKAKLLAMPEQPWTNVERSIYYGRLFNAAKVNATADTNRSLMRSSLSVRMKPAA